MADAYDKDLNPFSRRELLAATSGLAALSLTAVLVGVALVALAMVVITPLVLAYLPLGTFTTLALSFAGKRYAARVAREFERSTYCRRSSFTRASISFWSMSPASRRARM